MAKSDQIKLEIERLTSEASNIQATLREKTKLATSHYQQAKSGISQFIQDERAEIERTKTKRLVLQKQPLLKNSQICAMQFKPKTD